MEFRKSALSNIWSRSNNVFEASLTENILRNKIIILFYVWEFSADYIQILFYLRTAQKDKKFSNRLLEVHKNMWMLSQITLDVLRVFSFLVTWKMLSCWNLKRHTQWLILTMLCDTRYNLKPFLSNCFAHFCPIFLKNKVICFV